MKKNILILLAVVAVVTATYAGVVMKNTAAGLQVGTRSGGADSIGFWGATPTTQKFVTVSTDSTTLSNLINELVRIGIVKTN